MNASKTTLWAAASAALSIAAWAVSTQHEPATTAATAPVDPRSATVSRYHVHLPDLSLRDAVDQCVDVAHALVVSQRSVEPRDGLPFREIDLAVLSAVKNAIPVAITVRVPGTFDTTDPVVIPGSPRFHDGEEVVLFLHGSPDDGDLGIQALERGVLRVAVAAHGSASVHGPRAEDAPLDVFLHRCVQVLERR